jgi:hypothetical protein
VLRFHRLNPVHLIEHSGEILRLRPRFKRRIRVPTGMLRRRSCTIVNEEKA